jgi:molecular chaperone GrpE
MSKHNTHEGQEGTVPENTQTGVETAAKNAAENSTVPGEEGRTNRQNGAGDGSDSIQSQGGNSAEQLAAGPEEPTPEEKIAGLEAQIAETRDQLLRKAADFENFRKRMNQEKQNAIDFANQSLLLDIIPIIDDFERAIQSAEGSKDFADLPAGRALLDGIAMIEKRLTSQLESKWGLKRFDSAGEPFDPNRHEALMMEKSPDVSEPVVQEDLQKGYTLKDRVIRAAKVKVLMPGEHEGVGKGE